MAAQGELSTAPSPQFNPSGLICAISLHVQDGTLKAESTCLWQSTHCWIIGQQTIAERNVEQTKDVRMYIEEFILVDIWIHCCTEVDWMSIGRMLVYIHSQQRNEICENYS